MLSNPHFFGYFNALKTEGGFRSTLGKLNTISLQRPSLISFRRFCVTHDQKSVDSPSRYLGVQQSESYYDVLRYRGSPTSTVSTNTNSTSTNFSAIGIKFVLVEIGYVVPTSTNFAQYDFFKIPKIVLSEDPLYILTTQMFTSVHRT